jgi:23S rRNA pseudouridine2605 synthase
VHPDRLAALAKGITVDGVDYGPVEATLDRQVGANAWLTFALKEGKNREVRKICAHLGLYVNRLIRIAYGPFTLGTLPKRSLEEVDPKRLRQALGLEPKEKKQHRKGFAKAKPKANRPGSKRGFKHQREAAETGEQREKRQRRSPKAEAAQRMAAAEKRAAARKAPKKAPLKTAAAPKAAPLKPAAKKAAAKKPAAKKRIVKPAAKKTSAKRPGGRPATTPKRHANRRRPS